MELSRSQTPALKLGLLNSLRQLDNNHLLNTYLKTCVDQTTNASDVLDIQYEAAWRNSQWHMDTSKG